MARGVVDTAGLVRDSNSEMKTIWIATRLLQTILTDADMSDLGTVWFSRSELDK